MEDIQTRIASMEAKIDAIYTSVEKTRKYFQVVLWVTIAMVVLPIIALFIAIPMVLNMYGSMMSGLV